MRVPGCAFRAVCGAAGMMTAAGAGGGSFPVGAAEASGASDAIEHAAIAKVLCSGEGKTPHGGGEGVAAVTVVAEMAEAWRGRGQQDHSLSLT